MQMKFVHVSLLIMGMLSCIWVFCLILLMTINNSPFGNHLESADVTLTMMERSLAFARKNQGDYGNQSSASVPVFYSSEMKNFYEYTDFKRIKESTYSSFRQGDYGRITSMLLNQKYVNEKEGYNTLLNTIIPVDRLVPDLQPASCKYWHYLPEAMPKVSIIIASVQENEYILIRTLVSLLLNTPRALLQEIILVFDGNPFLSSEIIFGWLNGRDIERQNTELLKKFANFTAQMPLVFGEEVTPSLVKLLSTSTRVGLANALNVGARNATGDVLVFLKSSLEVPSNWLPPLLAPILDDTRTVVIPTFVDINHANFQFVPATHGSLQLIAWNWALHSKAFVKTPAGSNSLFSAHPVNIDALPYRLELLSSTQFAISREFFNQLGQFDAHYLLLEEETNLDMSLKIRQMAGRILKVPCSTVAVLKKKMADPMLQLFDDIYPANDFTFEPKCFLRSVAKKWFGQANMAHFETMHPSLLDDFCVNASNRYTVEHLNAITSHFPPVNQTNLFGGKVSDYRLVSGRLMNFIDGNSFLSAVPEANQVTGYLRNEYYSICLHLETSVKGERIQVEASYCRTKVAASVLRLDTLGMLRFENYCLLPGNNSDSPRFIWGVDCFFEELIQWPHANWQLSTDGKMLFGKGQCLTYADAVGIVLAPCSTDLEATQKWFWILS